MKELLKNIETKRILIYLGITFLLTYCYSFCVIYPLANTDNVSQGVAMLTQLLIAAAMFMPAIGVLLTRLITREGFKNAWLRPHFKGNIKTYLLAYFGPGILTLLGAVIYFCVFPGEFDANCGYMAATLEAAGTSAETIPMPLSLLMVIQGMQALFLGPILNFVTCFGEEWGWRGYLVPKMSEKLPAIPMLLVTGVIWGLWHAPLTAIGHNYGVGYPGFPFTGIGAMCCFCIVMGIFLSYITLKTGSCIPAVLAHGAINSIGAIGTFFSKEGGNPFVGPAPTGIVGGIPFILIAFVICKFYFTKKEK